MILVSACLLGQCCRYDGKSKPDPKVLELNSKEPLLPVCPEQMGGLPTPRTPVERRGDRAVGREGKDRTEQFKKGAEEACRLAKLYGCRTAILKSRSPSCGCGQIYDGSFSHTLTEGDGFAAEALKMAGIHVLTEEELDACLA